MIYIFIGISPRFLDKKIENINRKFLFLNYDYFSKLIKIELTPIILTKENLDNLLSICSGFIITGGDDINPKHYNQKNEFSTYDDELDEIDFSILDYAYKNNIPLLGICRGIQIINVYFNGSLIQDYKNHFNEHQVSYKNRRFIVNSSHHQIIKKLGNNLISLFKVNDVIECIIHKNKPILGVQWHPERMNTISSNFIFKYFKKEVIKYAQIDKRKNDL